MGGVSERVNPVFNVAELRLVRFAVRQAMDALIQRLALLDRDSDEAVATVNDLMVLEGILEKIKTVEEV